jgi:hypothetical protein
LEFEADILQMQNFTVVTVEEDLLQELGRQVQNTGGPGLFFHLRATSEREKW